MAQVHELAHETVRSNQEGPGVACTVHTVGIFMPPWPISMESPKCTGKVLYLVLDEMNSAVHTVQIILVQYVSYCSMLCAVYLNKSLGTVIDCKQPTCACTWEFSVVEIPWRIIMLHCGSSACQSASANVTAANGAILQCHTNFPRSQQCTLRS